MIWTLCSNLEVNSKDDRPTANGTVNLEYRDVFLEETFAVLPFVEMHILLEIKK